MSTFASYYDFEFEANMLLHCTTYLCMNLQLVVMIGVRKLLDKVFLTSELKILDDILPHFTRHERLDDEASCFHSFILFL